MAEGRKVLNVSIYEDNAEWLAWASKHEATTATAYLNSLIARDRMQAEQGAGRVARFEEWHDNDSADR
ncbi:MAG: hypothetical protein LKI25_05675 [Atopobiaceae bacterium]|jgi:hypothetical protein|nr:hypothetical protein [Atopobiaceae bacterium]MCI2173687.1 hypothetical protein [Atopobiaceae bacterium]MCI2207671.1 hypothetical protein [Atopobiaceae bacterium]